MKHPYGYKPYRGSRVRRRGIILNTLLAAAIIAAAVWVLCLLLPLNEGGLRFPGQQAPAADGTADADTPPASGSPSASDSPSANAAESSGSGASPGSAGEPAQEQPPEDPETGMSGGAAPISPMKNMDKAAPLFPELPDAPQNNRMVLLSADSFTEQAELLLSLWKSGAVTGAAVTMKDEKGILYYPSGIEDVQGRSDILKPVEGLVQAVSRLAQAGMPLTAVMYTHRDDRFPRLDEELALQNVNHVGWRDPDSRIFLDPANEEATAYLTAVAAELQELGFRELLLRGIGYPSYGWLERIAYADDRFGTVSGLVAAVQTAAPSVQVSVWLDTPELAQNEATGQSVGALYDAAFRVFAELPDTGPEGLLAAVGAAAGSTGKLVAMTGTPEAVPGLPAVLMDVPLEDLQAVT